MTKAMTHFDRKNQDQPSGRPQATHSGPIRAIIFLCCLAVASLWSWHALSSLTLSPATTTSVQQPTEAPTLTTKRIEEVQLGERLVGQNPLRDEVDESFPEVDPATWRQLRLHMTKPSGKSLFIELLRPLTWLNETGAAVGGFVHLDLKEMGAEGDAKVLAIEPCPPIQDGPGNVCTGKFIHESSHNLLDLKLEGQAEATGVTGNHPYWSVDSQEFVPAEKLRVGDKLQTASGSTKVLSITPRSQDEVVYNLEIHREHVYLVGSLGTLVHNSYLDDIDLKKFGRRAMVDPNHPDVMFREPEIFEANMNASRPFNQELSDVAQEIVFVRAADGKFHAINGNHRLMGARLDEVERVGARVISTEEYMRIFQRPFDPRFSTPFPDVVPGSRPNR